MSYFKANMHQIRFRLGLDPAGGAHSAPPDLLTGFEGVLLLREGKGMGGKGRGKGKKRKKGGRKGRKKGREGKEEKGESCVTAFGGNGRPCLRVNCADPKRQTLSAFALDHNHCNGAACLVTTN